MLNGKVPRWSIESGVDSLFVSSSLSDFTLTTAQNQTEVIKHNMVRMGAELAAGMFDLGVGDYTVLLMDPRPESHEFSTNYTIIGIPGEVQRLYDKIKELETSLMVERSRNAAAMYDFKPFDKAK